MASPSPHSQRLLKLRHVALVVTVGALLGAVVAAQQIRDSPDSPAATTTIDGR